jgi:hypothetical protein
VRSCCQCSRRMRARVLSSFCSSFISAVLRGAVVGAGPRLVLCEDLRAGFGLGPAGGIVEPCCGGWGGGVLGWNLPTAPMRSLAALMRFLGCPQAPIWANRSEANEACSPGLLGVQVPSDLPHARGWRVMSRTLPASGCLSCRASLRKIYRPLRHYFPSFKSQWMVSQAVVS